MSNPFSNLFSASQQVDYSTSECESAKPIDQLKLNEVLEKIFLLTLNKNYESNKSECIFIGDDEGDDDLSLLTFDNIDDVNRIIILTLFVYDSTFYYVFSIYYKGYLSMIQTILKIVLDQKLALKQAHHYVARGEV
jgi:hypothetical protein